MWLVVKYKKKELEIFKMSFSDKKDDEIYKIGHGGSDCEGPRAQGGPKAHVISTKTI